jgi:hypothetical protein
MTPIKWQEHLEGREGRKRKVTREDDSELHGLAIIFEKEEPASYNEAINNKKEGKRK